jgi:predicted aspartyl protease
MANQVPDPTSPSVSLLLVHEARNRAPRITGILGDVMRMLFGALSVVLASCTSTPRNNSLNRWSQPIVTWEGVDATTLPMDTVTLDGRLVFLVVELSMNGNRESFLVDSGCSTTSFTNDFARTLKVKIAVGQTGVIYGLDWSRKASTVVLDTIDLGFARLDNLEIPSRDLLGMIFNQRITTTKGRSVAGIIGVDLLVPLGASLDLANLTITFRRMPGRSPDLKPASADAAASEPTRQP